MVEQKDIKRMSRRDLLELLVLQSKKIDELQLELDKAKELLESKQIMISDVGSIAEATLKLNNVFEVAQKAADQYLENIKRIECDQEKIRLKLEKDLEKKKKKKTTTKKKTDKTKKTSKSKETIKV